MVYTRISEVDIKKEVDNKVAVCFVAKNIEFKPQKDGKECCHLIMKDKDKEVKAVIFGINEELKNKLECGKVYEAVIDVKDNVKYGLSCIISSIEKTTIDSSMFCDWVDNINEYVNRLNKLLEFISKTIYGEITYNIIKKYWDLFCKCPAATGMHHTSFGGLLMHSVCVSEGCLVEGKRYNEIYGSDFINLKLLVSGALLHDVMKVKELNIVVEENKVEYSNRSALTTHISDIDSEIVVTAVELGYKYDCEEILELRHLVLSHHGELEYGSPITGHMFESKILNFIDCIDASAWKFSKAYKDMQECESVHSWNSNGIDIIYRGKVGEHNEI